MGRVYLAYDPYLAIQVAIKTLPQPADGDENQGMQFGRFISEARHLAKVNHPHVVRIFDVCPDIKTPHIVMEYIDGIELTDLFGENFCFDLKKSLEMMTQICLGLQSIHDSQLIHRDLKPANIMLDSRGNIKIMDFGIVKDQNSTENLTTSLTGSPCSMSPEQIRGEKLNLQSDIFALGILFYQLLTGIHPFLGNTLGETFSNISHLEPLPPSNVNRRIPPLLDKIILKCLQKKASDRYENVPRLIRSLSKVQSTALNSSRSRHISEKVLLFSFSVFIASLASYFFYHQKAKDNRESTEFASLSRLPTQNLGLKSPQELSSEQDITNLPWTQSYIDLLGKCQNYPCTKVDISCININKNFDTSNGLPNSSLCYQSIKDHLKTISKQYPSVSCGDSICTFLERKCGICPIDCGNSKFAPNLPACRNLHFPEPLQNLENPEYQDQIRLGRVIYDDCYFRKNNQEMTTLTFAKLQRECLLEKKNLVIEDCSRILNIQNNNNKDLPKTARFLNCIIDGNKKN